MQDPIVSCVGWAALISGLTVLRIATIHDDSDTPKAYLAAAENAMSARPVVCLGDSITRGNLSADWVSDLRHTLSADRSAPGAVLNAGVNMQCAKNIQQRLREVIECRPSHVTVLVGTNDLKAELSSVEGFMYRFFGHLPEVPTLAAYESTLTDIREQLLATGARVALVSPPVLGEDMNSAANRRAAMFAETVKRVAEVGGERCTYLPLFEQTFAALPKEGGRGYNGPQFFTWTCLLCWDLHVLRRDLQDIQRERQLGVTIDLVHLGPAAATQLSMMVAAFIRGSPMELAPRI